MTPRRTAARRAVGAALLCTLLLSVACTRSLSSRDVVRPAPAPSVRQSASVQHALAQWFAADTTGMYEKRRALLVALNGKLLVEQYTHSSVSQTVDVQSVTKSVMGTLIGVALAQHTISAVDARLADLLPQYRTSMTPQMRGTSLRELLTMTSGLPDVQDPSASLIFTASNPVRAVLASGPRKRRGTFTYSNYGSHLLSAVLSAAVHRSTLDYARQTLFDPLGISTRPAFVGVANRRNISAFERAGFAWPTDPQGIQLGFGGIKLTARDLLKLGELWGAQGRWRGRQLVPASWMRQATREQISTAGPFTDGYGYQFWVGHAAGHSAFAAIGYGGQLVEVVPDLGIVVVVQSWTPADGRAVTVQASAVQYMQMVEQIIIPALGNH